MPEALAGFREKHWGKPNGREVVMGADGRMVCVKTTFGRLARGPILVRRTYLDLWTHLRDTYLDAERGVYTPSGATIIYGHPGIGKSVSLYFLMAAAAEHKVPFVFHRTGTGYVYVCLDAGEFILPSEGAYFLAFTTPAFAFVDSDSTALDSSTYDVCRLDTAHVVIAASPESSRRYRDIAKDRGAKYFTMALPSEEELRAIICLHSPAGLVAADRAVSVTEPAGFCLGNALASLADSAGGSSVDDGSAVPRTAEESRHWNPLEVFNLLGPNLRTALRVRLRVSGEPDELFPSVWWDEFMNDPVDILQLNSMHADPDAPGYHTLFFEQPGRSGPVTLYAPRNLCVPTPLLRSVVLGAFRRCPRAQQLGLLSKAVSGVRETFVEAALLDYIARVPFTAVFRPPKPTLAIGPRTSQSQPSDVVHTSTGATPLYFSAPDRMSHDCNLKATPLFLVPETPRFYSLPLGFSTADALLLADWEGTDLEAHRYEIMLQVTVANGPAIRRREVDAVANSLASHQHGRPRRRVFLFVTDAPDKSAALAAGVYRALEGWEIGSVTVTQPELLRALRAQDHVIRTA
ncbi:hypothetical protein AURDEDRAFT_165049 [Auricularia subglabra TFB-10046 SS5]|nr:hypothetical protein AURDEDRAFT_165049 [Auricularia subglabra TFB-10046 SS5]